MSRQMQDPPGPRGPKSDWSRQARAIVERSADLSEDEIYGLLCWLQDMNWPGAALVASRLAMLGPEIQEPLRRVLRSGDDVWIQWALSRLADTQDARFWQGLQVELQALASKIDAEGAYLEAVQLLARCKSGSCG